MASNYNEFISKVKDRINSVLITADYLVRVTTGSPLAAEYQLTYRFRCETKKWASLVNELRTVCKETGAKEEKTNGYVYLVYETEDVCEEMVVKKIIKEKYQCVLEEKGLFRYGFGIDVM